MCGREQIGGGDRCDDDHGDRPSWTTDDAFLAECLDKATDAKTVAAKATGGQWKTFLMTVYADFDGTSNIDTARKIANTCRVDDGYICAFDADFIAHARTSNPDLADRVTKLVDMVRQRDEQITSQQRSTISVDGLRPDQVRRLQSLLDDMRGWQFVGHAIAVGSDAYLWPNDTHGGEDKADVFATAGLAQAEFATIRAAMVDDDEELELAVVQLYKKGDVWDVVTPQ